MLACVMSLVAFAPVAGAGAAPQRIVSLHLCADELLLRLAAPGTVHSVTWLARDPTLSSVASEAQSIPINRGLAEEIVPLRPDLVIAGRYTTRTTIAMLRRLQVPVLELDVVDSVPAALRQIEQVARALGRGEQGAALVARMQSAMSAASAGELPGQRPLAAFLGANGFTADGGTLVDDLMRRAGLRNLATSQRPDAQGRLSVESLLWAQPDVLILSSPDRRAPALADELLRHPALHAALAGAHRVWLEPSWIGCPGPRLIDAFQALTQAAAEVGMLPEARSSMR